MSPYSPEFQRHLHLELADFILTTPDPKRYKGPFAHLVVAGYSPAWARQYFRQTGLEDVLRQPLANGQQVERDEKPEACEGGCGKAGAGWVYYWNNSRRVCADCLGAQIGPFPQEPAFGSPEATSRAAQDIAQLRSLMESGMDASEVRCVMELQAQRDELADALEGLASYLRPLIEVYRQAGGDKLIAGERLLEKADTALANAGRRS